MKKIYLVIASIIGIFAIGISTSIVSLFVFQSPVYQTNSCAFLGVSKIAPREMQQIQNSQEYQNIMTLSDDDLKEASKLSDLVHLVSNRIDYNDQFSFITSNSEMYLDWINQ
jgi:hypothetical protein